MLTCIFHPIDGMLVLDEDEAQIKKSSGIWFDHPQEAKDYRIKVEKKIKDEPKEKSIGKQRGKDHEKSSIKQ